MTSKQQCGPALTRAPSDETIVGGDTCYCENNRRDATIIFTSGELVTSKIKRQGFTIFQFVVPALWPSTELVRRIENDVFIGSKIDNA